MKIRNSITKNKGKILYIAIWVIILTISVTQGLANPGGIPIPPPEGG